MSSLTSSGQRNCALWAPQPQKSVTLRPQPGGEITKPIWKCDGIGGGGYCESSRLNPREIILKNNINATWGGNVFYNVVRMWGEIRIKGNSNLNPENIKTRLFYIRPQTVPLSKHCPPRLYKTNLLMLYKGEVAVCCKIHIKNINAKWAPCRIF
jgi:hypothetical protein